MNRKSPKQHIVKPHSRENTSVSGYVRGSGVSQARRRRLIPRWLLYAVPRELLEKHGTPEHPFLILDENISMDVENVLRDVDGYNVVHVRRIFKQGTPDRAITTFAESRNAYIITKDIMSFPEPKHGGDRIAIPDVPRERTLEIIRSRLREMGIRP